MQSSFFVQSTNLPGYLHEPKLPHQAPATPTLDERPGRDLFCPLQVHQRPVDDRERHRLARLDELREGSHSAIVARYTRTACRALHIFRRPGMRAASMAYARRCRISMMGRGNDCFSTGRIMVS